MSNLSTEASSASTAFSSQSQGYTLSDDLARLCLPSEYKDSYRTLAWVNSICFLFILIGLIGLKAPKVIIKPLSEITEAMPVELVQPQEQPQPQVQQQPDEEQPQDNQVETPQVVTVLAAADPSSVNFPVPVQGAIAVKEARLATPPPPNLKAPPRPTQFDPNAMTSGTFPDPPYPGAAQRNRYQGTVVIEFTVDASGTVTNANIQKSSGFAMLDDAALKTVKERWRFPPGPIRYYYKPFVFQLQ